MKNLMMMAMAVVMLGSMTAQAARADRRQTRQEKRVQQGVKSGQLTPEESARLEARHEKIEQDITNARANDGKLDPRERRKINREQNRLSRSIYRQKHDAQAVTR